MPKNLSEKSKRRRLRLALSLSKCCRNQRRISTALRQSFDRLRVKLNQRRDFRMNTKLWLIARHEYRHRASKRSFLVGTFFVPLLIAAIVGITIFIIEQGKDTRPLGYLDHSGVLNRGILPQLDSEKMRLELIRFNDYATARSALEAEQIQAFFVLPGDYLESLKIDLYYLEDPPDQRAIRYFDDFIRANLLPQGPNEIQNRIIAGVNLTLLSADGRRVFKEGIGFLTILFPLAVSMLFFFAVMGSSGYFLQAVTDEKESRTMEIAITSVSPWQLMGGKFIGLMGVALTQIAIWVASLVMTWAIARQLVDELQGVHLPWEILLLFAIFFVPSFALAGGMMAAVGAAVTEYQEGQQIAGMLNLLFTFPLFLTGLIFADPDSPLLVFLSFWPTSSLLTLSMRWGVTQVPVWQLALSWLILVGTGSLTIWAAARIFRIGMLQYGQRLSWKAVVGALNQPPQQQHGGDHA